MCFVCESVFCVCGFAYVYSALACVLCSTKRAQCVCGCVHVYVVLHVCRFDFCVQHPFVRLHMCLCVLVCVRACLRSCARARALLALFSEHMRKLAPCAGEKYPQHDAEGTNNTCMHFVCSLRIMNIFLRFVLSESLCKLDASWRRVALGCCFCVSLSLSSSWLSLCSFGANAGYF